MTSGVSSGAVRRLRDIVRELVRELEGAFVTQAVVTALGPGNAVTVRLASTAPGGPTLTVPRLRSYDDPKVGDVAVLVGPPGSWFALGALA